VRRIPSGLVAWHPGRSRGHRPRPLGQRPRPQAGHPPTARVPVPRLPDRLRAAAPPRDTRYLLADRL